MSENRVGSWIERELRSRDWRQADLARRAGVSTTAVSDWVRGKRIPDPASCDMLADIFYADLDYVLDLAGHRPPDPRDDDNGPVSRITAMVARVKWSPQREAIIERILAEYLEWDRKGGPSL